MLQFIFGRAASGKSTYIYQHILKNTQQHGNVILLVPEQYTFETEKAMLSLLGGGFASKVEVLSFTRMAENAGRLYGGIAGKRVSDAERNILMGKAIQQNLSQLQIFRRFCGAPAFVAQMIAVITELKMAAVSAAQLYQAAAVIADDYLRAKLQEIALLYAAYDALLEGVFIDPQDEPERFYRQALAHGYFKNKVVYLDAFKGFTGQQIKVLQLMLRDSKAVYLSLCTPGFSAAGSGVFANVAALADKLKTYAASNHIPVNKPVILQPNSARPLELQRLEGVLAGDGAQPFEPQTERLVLAEADNPKEEVAFVFQTIRRLVRQQHYRYDDFVIIARDITKYEEFLAYFGRRDEIPCFFDRRTPLCVSPLIRFVLFALRAARSYDSASILSMLKTGFSPYSAAQIGALEEYIYIWNIKGKQWLQEWEMNPNGFVTEEAVRHEQTVQRLERLNQLRFEIVQALQPLNRAMSQSALEISTQIYRLLTVLKIDEAVRREVSALAQSGDNDTADFISASWEELMQVLDSIVLCVGDQPLNAQQYLETFEACIRAVSVGNIPRTLDEVSAGSADRIRPSRPKVAFILGMNQGQFPAVSAEGGLLLKSDRLKLEQAGLELSDRYQRFAIDENFLVYAALTCADERVYLCRNLKDFDGSSCEPSPIIDKILRYFPNITTCSTKQKGMPETKAEAYSACLSRRGYTAAQLSAMQQLLEQEPAYEKQLKQAAALENTVGQRLLPETAARLFEAQPELSATKLERYYHCPFSYFCQYVLRATKLQRAELNPMQRGTIVHYVLENALKTLGPGLKQQTKQQLFALTEQLMQQYLAAVPGSEQLTGARFQFVYRELGQTILMVLLHLQQEFLHSDFVPERFELSIGGTGEVPALVLHLPNGKTVSVVGKIDRLDALQQADQRFIRVVDYKTGNREFYLADVLSGFNMQMLLYLYAVKKMAEGEQNSQIAGILYMPSKRDITEKDETADPLRMNGLLSDDDAVLKAMDRENSGRFIPKKSKQNRRSFIPAADFETIFAYIDGKVTQAATEIYQGNFDILPTDGCESNACKYCDFETVCRRNQRAAHGNTEKYSAAETVEKMREALKHGV